MDMTSMARLSFAACLALWFLPVTVIATTLRLFPRQSTTRECLSEMIASLRYTLQTTAIA
jgi:hypothetical protein